MLTIQKLYSKTSLNQLIAGLFLFILIWSNVDFLLSIIPNAEKFKAGKYVILFIGLGRLTDMATGINSEIISNSSYYKFNLILVLCSTFLLVGGNYLLIPLYGINGTAISTLLSFVLFNVVKSLFIFIKFNMQPFTAKSLLILVCAFIAYIAAVNVPEVEAGIFSPFINIALRSVLVAFVFISSVIYFKVSEDVDLLKDQLLKRIKR